MRRDARLQAPPSDRPTDLVAPWQEHPPPWRRAGAPAWRPVRPSTYLVYLARSPAGATPLVEISYKLLSVIALKDETANCQD